MFCPNCGNNLPDNAAFCGNCGTALKAAQPQQPQQTQQQYYAQPNQAYQQYYAQPNQAFAAPYTGAVKTGALVMVAILILFSVLPIILWFCENVGVEAFGNSETATWSELWPDGDDRVIVEVFRWIGVVLLAINACLGIFTVVTGKYKVKRTRFILSRIVSLINLLGFVILYIAFLDELSFMQDYAIMTFGGVMFIISCVVLFVLPFFISHATKPAAPAYQAYQQPYQTPYQQY